MWVRGTRAAFELAIAKAMQAPKDGLPEIGFSGRSNVGKSSLINALTIHHGLARTSKTPGRTQQIIFFNVAKKFRLVDFPGYGFAKAPKKVVNDWNQTVYNFVQSRDKNTLRSMLVLIDSRRGILQMDFDWLSYLQMLRLDFRIVFTKCDKVSKAAREELEQSGRAQMEMLKKGKVKEPSIFFVSAKDKIGLNELRDFILDTATVEMRDRFEVVDGKNSDNGSDNADRVNDNL